MVQQDVAGPQLKKRGWVNVHDGGDKYWSFRIYQKR